MSEGLLVLLRTGGSLVLVLAVIWVATKLLGRATGARGSGVVEVIARHQLGRTSSVAVVRVADRAFVLGVTDTQVTLLDETDLATVSAPTGTKTLADGTTGSAAHKSSALQGSALSPATWRASVEALRERTVRR